MVKRINYVVGVEFELEYNRDKLGVVRCASYHSGVAMRFNKDFVVEADGSLYRETFVNGDCVEIISKPFLMSNYKKVLDGFRAEIVNRLVKKGMSRDDAGKVVLSDVISFNKSTGTHIHITPIIVDEDVKSPFVVDFKGKSKRFNGKPFIIRDAMSIDFVKSFRHSLIRNVKRSVFVDNPEAFGVWKDKLFRRYAKKTTIASIRNNDRYQEFNLSIPSKYRVEFRSFHLTSVNSWEDFYKIFDVLFSTMRGAFKKELRSVSGGFKEEREFVILDAEAQAEINVVDEIVVNGLEVDLNV